MGCLAQDTLVLAQFAQNGMRLGSERGGIGGEKINQGADRIQAFAGAEPLRSGEMMGPFGVAGSLLEKKGHRVFVGREVFEQRTDMQPARQTLQRVFIAGQRLSIDENVVSGVIALDHYVKAGGHQLRV